MNNDTHWGLRTAMMAMLIAGIALLAGCGSDVGPSVDKVRLDLLDRMNQMYGGLLETHDFEIDERQVLSEDRVKFHIVASFKLDPERAQQVRSSHSKTIRQQFALRKAGTLQGKDERATLIYKRTGQGAWQIYNVQQGYQ
tara:strand:- start:114 stop:533 length:420 start_codon:yes stop_codon:yes gene_type:complete